MCPNYNLIPALILGFALYKLGQWLSRRVVSAKYRWLLGGLFLLLCMPALSFILYYTHIFGEPLWYVQFRSIDFIEVLSAMWGLLFGFMLLEKPERKVVNSGWRLFCFLLIFIPFAKSYLFPPEILGMPIKDRWQDGICMQTTHSTCGPASLATILTFSGIPASERDVAYGSYTAASSTEIWYIIRYARNHGMQVNVMVKKDLSQITMPAILGTGGGRYGHFIVLLEKKGEAYIFGDPLIGRRELTETEFYKAYGFNGFAVSFTRQ